MVMADLVYTICCCVVAHFSAEEVSPLRLNTILQM